MVANLLLFVQLFGSLWLTGISSLSLLCILLWLPVVAYHIYFIVSSTAELRKTLESRTPDYRNRFDRDFAKLCPMDGGGITEDYVVSTCWGNRISLGLISNITRAYSGFSSQSMGPVLQSSGEHVISPNLFVFFNDNSCIKIKCSWSQRSSADKLIDMLLERNPRISTTALPEDRRWIMSYSPLKKIMWSVGLIAYIILCTVLVVFIPL